MDLRSVWYNPSEGFAGVTSYENRDQIMYYLYNITLTALKGRALGSFCAEVGAG